MSSSDMCEGMVISLEMAEEEGTAMAQRLAFAPLRLSAFPTELATASVSAMFFSTTAFAGKGSTE